MPSLFASGEDHSMSEWQPIETAPIVGTVILASWSEAQSRYIIDAGFWEDFDGGAWWPYTITNPTHWMPMPAPPEKPMKP
jgi:hypothetical protein